MDIFVTSLELAGVSVPSDRAIDGVSLVPALLQGGSIDRDIYFYYRDYGIYAVRYKSYKAHYYTRGGFSMYPSILFLLKVNSSIRAIRTS